MLESATEFSKAGFTPEDSARLAQVSSLFQNIADSEVSAGDAASFIISQMKAFNIEADDATSILDKVNEVSNNFAVSSTDITSALTKQSASLAAYGNNLDKSISLVTAGAEIMTHQSGKVARGLRTIGANITQLAQGARTFEFQVNGAIKSIELWNDTGTDMLDTYDVLKQIAAVWDEMSNAEKSSLAITLAKKTQMDTFLAVLGNFESAEKAYTTALLSEGSAWKENAEYMESVEAHAKSLQQQWEQLVLSAPIENLEKALLSAGTAILKFANSDLGQTVIKVTALMTALGLAAKAVAVFKTVLTSGNFLSIFVHMLGSALAGTTSLTAAMGYLTTAMLANPLFWGATAILGIAGIVKLIDKLNVTFEESAKKLHELNEEVKDGESKVSSLKQKLEEVKKELDKIKESKLQITDNKELENLQKQQEGLERVSAELRNQLDIEEQILEKKREQQATVAKQTMSKTTGGTIYNVDLSQEKGVAQFGESGLGSYDFSGKAYEYADKLLQGLSATQTKIHDCEEAMQGLNEETEEYQRLQDEQAEYNRQWNEMNGELLEILPTMQDIISSGQDLEHTYQDIFDRWHLAIEERKDTNIAGLTEEDVKNSIEILNNNKKIR